MSILWLFLLTNQSCPYLLYLNPIFYKHSRTYKIKEITRSKMDYDKRKNCFCQNFSDEGFIYIFFTTVFLIFSFNKVSVVAPNGLPQVWPEKVYKEREVQNKKWKTEFRKGWIIPDTIFHSSFSTIIEGDFPYRLYRSNLMKAKTLFNTKT